MKDKLLNLAMAAKTVGITRSTLQQMVQEGELESFEGMLKLSDLKAVCPRAENIDTSAMLEKTQFIKDNAYANRVQTAHMPDQHTMYSQIKKLRLELKMEKQRSMTYLLAINDLRDKLIAAEKKCEGKQRELITNLLHSISITDSHKKI